MLTGTRRSAAAAYALVATACLFGLVVLRAERLVAANLNDSAVHTQMVRYIGRKLEGGDWPLSGWYPFWALGYPFLQHYQAVPALLTAMVGSVVGDDVAHAWALYLLLALWPIAVYASARLFELDRLTAGCAALISPLLTSASSYGYEHQSYVWQGFGIWTQLFGMWVLPLSWALSWRALCRGGSMFWAALALTATLTLHFLTGYQALCAVGIWVLVGGRTGILRRLGRAVILWVVAVLGSAWVLVPLLSDGAYAGHSITEVGNPDFDSYGAGKILGWLFTGDLYDAGRAPVVTVLVAVGLVVVAARWRALPAAPALLAIFTFSFLLWFGRPFWGGLTALLPGSNALLLHRFIMGTHLAGILIAGVGLGWLVGEIHRLVSVPFSRLSVRRGSFAVPALLASVVLLALVPSAKAIRAFDQLGAQQIAYQRSEDAVSGAQVRELAANAVSRGTGRVYAGSRNNWGQAYRVGQVPVYAVLAAADIDAPGFTLRAPSLSVDVESYLNADDPSQLRLLGIRWLIYPSTRPAPAGATLLRALGDHRLYGLDGIQGLVSVGNIEGSVVADNSTVGKVTLPYLTSGRADRGSFDAVAFSGADPLPLTVPPGVVVDRPGSVVAELDDGDAGAYTAGVAMDRAGVAVLKASYHKHWNAYVDGVRVRVGMVSPSFVGAQVPAGNHTVEFRFEGPDQHVPLLLLGLVTFVVLFVLDRRRSR